MKNMEVLHTLRLYDSDFIMRLGLLLEREQKNYRNRNEFLTALLKNGYEAYTAAKQANGATGAGKESTAPKTNAAAATLNEGYNEIYSLLSEMNQFMILQFKAISLYQEIQQKLLSAVYRTTLSLAGGEKVMPSRVEAGFFDELPARFEKIILSIKKQMEGL